MTGFPCLPRALSWVQEFVNFQPPYDEKDKSKTRRKGGLHILMDYFTLLDEETRCDKGWRWPAQQTRKPVLKMNDAFSAEYFR